MPRLHHRSELKAIRRDLRSHPTVAEDYLWKRLRRRQLGGWKFRRQHSVGSYVLDFYCPEVRLGIELDGTVHRDPLRSAYDAARQAWLEAQGIRVLRFRNEEVLRQLDLVLGAITLGTLMFAIVGESTRVFEEMGSGGIERWVAYPAVAWLLGFGGYLGGARDLGARD